MSTCYAEPNPIFQPAMRLISAITTAYPAIVTTTFAHQYVDGTIVRLNIPVADGMQEANGLFGPITILNSTQFSITIDSTFFTPFSIPVSPPPYINTCAMVIPIGEINSTLAAAVRNVLPL